MIFSPKNSAIYYEVHATLYSSLTTLTTDQEIYLCFHFTDYFLPLKIESSSFNTQFSFHIMYFGLAYVALETKWT